MLLLLRAARIAALQCPASGWRVAPLGGGQPTDLHAAQVAERRRLEGLVAGRTYASEWADELQGRQ